MSTLMGLCWMALSNVHAAAQSAVPVEQEPAHHLVLQNEHVRVFHVQLPAGAVSLWHVHTRDGISVRIGDATIQDEPLGGPAKTFELHRGAVSFGATPVEYTHRVNNIGPTSFDNVYIELSGAPGNDNRNSAEPEARGPAEFENERVRVLRRVLAPGEATELHAHPANAVAVVVTPGTLQVTQADGTVRTLEPQPGAVQWVAAGTIHALHNTGSAPMEIVDVELN